MQSSIVNKDFVGGYVVKKTICCMVILFSLYAYTDTQAEYELFRVDIAMPASKACSKPCTDTWPGTAKQGWWPWAAPSWQPLYRTDMVWEDGNESFPENGPGINGTGVHSSLCVVYEQGLGDMGLRVCALQGRLAGDYYGHDPYTPTGEVLHDPICNTWVQSADWPDNPWGNTLLTFYGLDAGVYELYSYHNHFDCFRVPGTDEPTLVECSRASNPQPPIVSIKAYAVKNCADFYDAPYQGKPTYAPEKFMIEGQMGSGDVETLEAAYNVVIQQVTSDDELIPSRMKFRTDGSAVLIIYEAGCCVHDQVRPTRSGGRAILNAFRLVQLEGSPGCDLNKDGVVNFLDFSILVENGLVL